jgi:isoleucyl-tRNA synthetase
MAKDYKDTVFLPQTDFPMRGNLAVKEPEILKSWQEQGLYKRLREISRGREKFILHDGPPYANGELHVGHALGSILKDVINRSQQMGGKDAPYVLGWDCHGLPIEWKVEEKYRAEGKNKDEVPVLQFRAECRAFARHWVNVQAAGFARMGLLTDTEHPYLTMTDHAEARIVGEIHKFLLNGGLYQGVKPVFWSVVEKTALAEAEVEYHDHKSPTIWVKFRIEEGRWQGASVVIWTTTPWTIPANRGVAYGEEIEYGLYEVMEVGEGSTAIVSERLVLAVSLAEKVFAAAKVTQWKCLETVKGAEIGPLILAHPFKGRLQGYPEQTLDYAQPSVFLPGDFVTEEAGTGFVHLSPAHGEDDYILWRARLGATRFPSLIDAEGAYYPWVPVFAGKRIYTADGKPGDANGAVIKELLSVGGLLAKGSLTHSYPHSWRSKAPVIYRTTAQWFISMETNDLRTKALDAIEETRFVPAQGKTRLRSMVETRPDWCISRQRSWGVPIAIFLDLKTGKPLADPEVLGRIQSFFEKEGADAWYARPSEDFLGPGYDAGQYEKVMDVVDVWFESGSTHSFVLEDRSELRWPADVYAEGSDQHRGWFQSSLLESCGTRGRAPFGVVITHGFLLDEKGYKMSKSLGNVTNADTVCTREGADVLRLWAISSDYTQDVAFGPEILKQNGELYRRLRNTLRYLLGALDGFSDAERLPIEEMAPLERWVLHQLWSVNQSRGAAIDAYDFTQLITRLHHFAAVDLSAFYFDIRKDSLYCDKSEDKRRRGTRTVMAHIFDCLVTWLAPVLCFTAEEAWAARGHKDSVHLEGFAETPEAWRNDELAAAWDRLRAIRGVVTGALEKDRADKKIGASLQSAPILFVETAEDMSLLSGVDLAEILITSGARLREEAVPRDAFTLPEVPGIGVATPLAEGDKCERCWRILPEVKDDLCARCTDAVAHTMEAAE